MKNRRLSAVPTFRLRPLSLALLALFAGPTVAQETITGHRAETISVDTTDTTGYQIGERNGSNDPTQSITDTTLTFGIAADSTLTFSGVQNTSMDDYLGAGGAINVNVAGDAATPDSPLKFTSGGSLVFSGNQSYRYGGAVGARFAGADQASVFDFSNLASLAFLGNIAGNTGNGYGGGIYSSSTSTSSVTLGAHALFSGNRAGAAAAAGRAEPSGPVRTSPCTATLCSRTTPPAAAAATAAARPSGWTASAPAPPPPPPPSTPLLAPSPSGRTRWPTIRPILST